MKKKILFLLQNGIGFGHFKLALTLSEYLKDRYEIIFITQAKSTELFKNFNYRVYNFPMLYTVNSNTGILLFSNLLNKLVEQIDPDIVIEDTYPEERYLNLPALINTPRILLINRLISSEFEEYYFSGILNNYNKLIVLKNKEKLIEDLSSGEVKNFIRFSHKVVCYENVFNIPSSDMKNMMSRKYNIERFDKSIVVSCGAGGWHIGENICKTIYLESINAANLIILNNQNILMTIVLGPYSSYLKEELKKHIKYPDNIKLIDFEPHLDALYHVADLNILRPGYNSTMEVISGKANILLLPGISYMETQDEWCKELSKTYGVDYLHVKDIDGLHSHIKRLLKKNIRTNITIQNNAKNVALEIEKSIHVGCKNLPINLAFNISDLGDNITIDRVKTYSEKNNISIIDKTNCLRYRNYSFDIINKIPILDNSSSNPIVIYNDEALNYNRKSFYEKRYLFEQKGRCVLEYNEINISYKHINRKYLVNILTQPNKYSDNVVIHLGNKSYEFIRGNVFNLLEEMLSNGEIYFKGLDYELSDLVNQRASNYNWNYSKPEISKLK